MTTENIFPFHEYLSHISLDCVVFGFNNNELKVLMLKLKHSNEFALPGGFLKKDETLEAAAIRVLQERTGLNDIFLRQFKVFSDLTRSNYSPGIKELIASEDNPISQFLSKRFVSVGFYALVDFSKVKPSPDFFSESCGWKNVGEEIPYLLDHKKIISDALEQLRLQLNSQPIGYNLLPAKFTMAEFQRLYETILGRTLDKRNFQRKVLSYKILNKLEERRMGGAYKSPFLYEFDLERYEKALEEGLRGVW